MTTWIILAAVLGIAAWLAAWSRHPGRARSMAVAAFPVALAASGCSLLVNLGWAVPMYPYVSTPSGEVSVIGLKLVPEEAIYVLLDLESGPRLFVLPWNAEQASKLQRAMEGGEGEGELKMRMKGEFAPGEFYMEKAPEPLVEEKQPETEGFTF